MKKFILIPIFCIYGVLFSQNVKNDLVGYVEEHYSQILERIPLGKENLYGFENREMFQNCEVGTPIKMLRIKNENEIEITNEWRVPLLFNGNPLTLLTVLDSGQNYEIVNIGGNILAKLIDNYNSDGKKISYMLRDFRNKTDYVSFELNSLSDKNFYKIEKSSASYERISLDEIIRLHNINE